MRHTCPEMADVHVRSCGDAVCRDVHVVCEARARLEPGVQSVSIHHKSHAFHRCSLGAFPS